MLSKILKKSTCASCKFCCVFSRKSLWEVPNFPIEKLEELKNKLEVNSKDKIPFTTANERKVDKTLGSLKYFFMDNKEKLLLIFGDDYETFEKCITLYSSECRNYSFHKSIINDWYIVETIRKNTFFMYVMLLGSCKLQGTREAVDNAFCVIDDRLEQLSLYIDDWKISDFFYQYGKACSCLGYSRYRIH